MSFGSFAIGFVLGCVFTVACAFIGILRALFSDGPRS